MRFVHATSKTWYKVLYQHTMYVISLSLNLKKVAYLIQGVWYNMLYHHTVVIKEWPDVTRDLLCRTIVSWRQIFGMRGNTSMGSLKSDSTHHFFRNACTKSGCVWYKMLYHHTVVIKEWRDVTRDLLCRTIVSWRQIIEMRGKHVNVSNVRKTKEWNATNNVTSCTKCTHLLILFRPLLFV
jgi:hypothetical protein